MSQQPEARRTEKRGCLARTIGSAMDGAILGGGLGGIMAMGQAATHGISASAISLVVRSAIRSGLSLAGFLAAFNGGTCSLESARGKSDVFNPFAVGCAIGIAGALPGWIAPLPHAPYLYRNNRALAGAGLSSAMLCSFFYFLSGGAREVPAVLAPPAAVPSGFAGMPPPVRSVPALEAEDSYTMQPAVEPPQPEFAERPDPTYPYAQPPSQAQDAGRGCEQLVDKWA